MHGAKGIIKGVNNLGLEGIREGFMEKMLPELRPQVTKSMGQEWERTVEAEGSTNVKVWRQEKHVELGITTIQYGWSTEYWERVGER